MLIIQEIYSIISQPFLIRIIEMAYIYTNKPLIKADLSGKTVMVIGANTGIGYETAKNFTTMQPTKVIITARNEGKAAEAVSRECAFAFVTQRY